MDEEGTMIEGDDEQTPIAATDVDDWEMVEVDEPDRTQRSIVLSVRFSDQEMRRLREESKRTGASLSDVVREAVRVRFAFKTATPVLLSASTPNVYGVPSAFVVTHALGAQIDETEAPATAS
jgi:hypothetical protein